MSKNTQEENYLTVEQQQAFEALILHSERIKENKQYFKSLTALQSKVFTIIPEQLRTLDFVRVINDKIERAHFDAISALPDQDQLPENLQAIRKLSRWQCFAFMELNVEEKTLKNLMHMPTISQEQFRSLTALNKIEQKFHLLQKLPKRKFLETHTFLSLPETERTLDLLRNFPQLHDDQCWTFIGLPEGDRRLFNLKRMPNLQKRQYEFLSILPETENNFNNLFDLPELTDTQLKALRLLCNNNCTISTAKQIPEVNDKQLAIFQLLPHEHRNVQSLKGIPQDLTLGVFNALKAMPSENRDIVLLNRLPEITESQLMALEGVEHRAITIEDLKTVPNITSFQARAFRLIAEKTIKNLHNLPNITQGEFYALECVKPNLRTFEILKELPSISRLQWLCLESTKARKSYVLEDLQSLPELSSQQFNAFKLLLETERNLQTIKNLPDVTEEQLVEFRKSGKKNLIDLIEIQGNSKKTAPEENAEPTAEVISQQNHDATDSVVGETFSSDEDL